MYSKLYSMPNMCIKIIYNVIMIYVKIDAMFQNIYACKLCVIE